MANEAVGALRDALKALSGYEDYNDNEANPQAERGQVALALLERLMGAMSRALRGCRTHLKCTDGCACDVCAALTDAPPVFTLEEVREALAFGGVRESQHDDVLTALATLRR